MTAFTALEPRWLRRDRFYKIYLGHRELIGALIARQVYDEESAQRQMIGPAQFLAPLMRLWARRILRRVRERESTYDGLTCSPELIVRQDPLNFRLPLDEIVELQVDTARRLWTGKSAIAGTLHLKLRDGSRRQWILPGDQDIEAAAGWIRPALNLPQPVRA